MTCWYLLQCSFHKGRCNVKVVEHLELKLLQDLLLKALYWEIFVGGVFLTVEHHSNKIIEKNTLLYLFIYYLTAAMLPAINTVVFEYYYFFYFVFLAFFLWLICVPNGKGDTWVTLLDNFPLKLGYKSVLK